MHATEKEKEAGSGVTHNPTCCYWNLSTSPVFLWCSCPQAAEGCSILRKPVPDAEIQGVRACSVKWYGVCREPHTLANIIRLPLGYFYS